MLPRYQGKTTTEVAEMNQQSQSGRRGGNQQRQRDGHQYLKWNDLKSDPTTCKILACQPMPDNFNKKETLIMTKISLNGEIRLFPLRVNNPNLGVLQEAFGVNENDWVDKKFLAWTEEHDVTGQHQIVVEVREDTNDGKKKKRGT